VPAAGEIVSMEERFEARVTILPGTGLIEESYKVTVMIELETPSAATDPGDAFKKEKELLAVLYPAGC
jgi:hypothetical protein